jgi:CRISPR-associated Csx2 family protein
MARKLYSFLGTNEYRELSYMLPGNLGASSPTRFVQTAIWEMLQRRDELPDEIIVFLTEDAKAANWFSRTDARGNVIPGLHETWIAEYGESSCRLKTVDIEDDDHEDALWRLFERMAEEAGERDEIFIDITYGFRSTPAVSLIIGDYVSVLRKIRLKGLYYGKVDHYSSTAVIHDMTEMLILFKWTQAIESYLRTGNAQLLLSIVKEQAPVHEVDWGFMELAERLNNVSMSIETCRGQMVEDAILKALELLRKLKADPSGKLKPFRQLLDQIARKFSGFQPGRYEQNLLFIVEWCINHHLYQQGYTFLHEGILTILTRHVGWNPVNRQDRERVKGIIYKVVHNRDGNPRLTGDEAQLARRWKPFASLLAFFAKLTDYRNNINHGQVTDQRFTYDQVASALADFYNNTRGLINSLHEIPRG